MADTDHGFAQRTGNPVPVLSIEEMINHSDIPCKILNDVRDVWIIHFSLTKNERTLYPKDCIKWIKKS